MRSFSKRRRRSFPELEFLATDQERHTAWRQAIRTIYGSPKRWLILFGATALTVVAAVVAAKTARPLLGRFVHLPPGVLSGIVGGLLGGTATTGWVWFFRREIRDSLRQQLLERGIPICIKCGYNLRGQTQPRCPECGGPFDPALLSATDEPPNPPPAQGNAE